MTALADLQTAVSANTAAVNIAIAALPNPADAKALADAAATLSADAKRLNDAAIAATTPTT